MAVAVAHGIILTPKAVDRGVVPGIQVICREPAHRTKVLREGPHTQPPAYRAVVAVERAQSEEQREISRVAQEARG